MIDRATEHSKKPQNIMEVYTTKKESQELLKKHFSPGESLSPSQDPGIFTRLDAGNSTGEGFSAFPLNKQPRENEQKGEKSDLESLSANSNSSSREELELELDINYISRHYSPQTRSHQYISLYCSACGHRYIAPVKCDRWRICSHCRKRESYRLISKYLRMVKSIPRVKLRLITVTTRNTQKLTRQTIQEVRSYWLKLLHLKRYEGLIRGGFYSIEAKNTGKGWNVHLHSLCEVPDKSMLSGSLKRERATRAEKQLSKDWKKITKNKAKIVDIKNVASPGGALRYILKDLLKSPTIQKMRSFEYLTALKSCRLLSTFGSWYHKIKDLVSTRRFKCPNCNNDIWIDQFFLRDIDKELNFARAP